MPQLLTQHPPGLGSDEFWSIFTLAAIGPWLRTFLKIDNSIGKQLGGAIGDPCWWSLTYFECPRSPIFQFRVQLYLNHQTVSLFGPSAESALKGITKNFPHTSFPLQAYMTFTKTFGSTSLSPSSPYCLVTNYFHRRENKTMQDYVSIIIGHWVVISLNLAVLLVYSCSDFLAKRV